MAVLCLTAWERKKEPLAPLVDTFIHRSGLPALDRHLAVNLVHGVLRRMQSLDTVITKFSKFPLNKMKTLTIMALRVGVFQIIFLDRIPESAAVNETVNVMKMENQPRWLVNFVNGVLRSVARNQDRLPEPMGMEKGTGPVLDHPDWLVSRWQAMYGESVTREICRVNNSEPLLTLRVNTRHVDPGELTELFRQKGFVSRPGKYAPDSLVLEGYTGPVTDLPGYEDGLFHIQDEAAQLVSFLLGPFDGPGDYLDGCAGLGGKTCQLDQMIHPGASLYAVEPSSQRFRLLKENCQRMHSNEISIFNEKLDAFAAATKHRFRGILIDAPCSGTGVIRRHPDIRWNRREKDLLSYRQKQLELLEQGGELVTPGGVMVYATCSIEPEENGEIVASFLRKHKDFTVSDCRQYLPDTAVHLVSGDGFFAPTPADGMDGFFGARLLRAG